jgi:hypothetical protein
MAIQKSRAEFPEQVALRCPFIPLPLPFDSVTIELPESFGGRRGLGGRRGTSRTPSTRSGIDRASRPGIVDLAIWHSHLNTEMGGLEFALLSLPRPHGRPER